nr:DNA repair protein complementing XP A cells [Hymenolepis microstoma]
MRREDERSEIGEEIEGVIAVSSASKQGTDEEQERIENNRKKALDLLNSEVVLKGQANIVIKGPPIHHSKPIDTGGGFFIDPPPLSQSQGVIHFEKSEEETDQSDEELGDLKRRKKRRRKLPPAQQSPSKEQVPSSQYPPEAILIVPRPPDEEKPVCDECSRTFDDSFLLSNFDCQVCDACRDYKGIHSLITRTSAKDRYLLSDVDLDVREPPLRRIFKKNPRNSTWGDMQLFLEAQVAARSLEVWGSEENVEAERSNRAIKREKAKERGFQKRVKELRLQVRSSLYTKKSATHEHTYGPEAYDETTDTYSKSCTSCDHKMTFEKM